MPDSHLINEQEFTKYVKEDRTVFKIVKYFTPHCQYCRYLKQVVDKLKHEQEWRFQIYDLNCQWYPQLCNIEVRAGAFPYVGIYD